MGQHLGIKITAFKIIDITPRVICDGDGGERVIDCVAVMDKEMVSRFIYECLEYFGDDEILAIIHNSK